MRRVGLDDPKIPEPYVGMVIFDPAYHLQRWRVCAAPAAGRIEAERIIPRDAPCRTSWDYHDWTLAWQRGWLRRDCQEEA